MDFLKNNFMYMLPIVLFISTLFLIRERLKEKRTIIWVVTLSIVFILIAIFEFWPDNTDCLETIKSYNEDSLANIAIFSCIAGSIFWYILAFICKSRGYQTSAFVNHQWDIKNGIKIIKNSDESPLIRLFVGILLIGIAISLIVVILIFFLM